MVTQIFTGDFCKTAKTFRNDLKNATRNRVLTLTICRARLWRRKKKRYQDANLAQHDKWGDGSLIVWDGISRQGKTDLRVLERGPDYGTGVRSCMFT